jgi:TRAP transporter TAXI family solute receptor
MLLGTLGLMAAALPRAVRAQGFFRIRTGAPSSTYYPVGTAIAGVIGAPEGGRPCELGGGCGVEGLVALVQSSRGSVENVDAIEGAEAESGFVQADIAYYAANAEGPFAKRPRFEKLRGICSLFDEALHLVVTPTSGIASIRDLRGKRVAVGSAGSGTAISAKRLLEVFDLSGADVTIVEIDAVEALGRMRVGALEAMFVMAGAPVEVVTEAVLSLDAQLVRIDGGPVDRLLHNHPFLMRATIPAGAYPGSYGSTTLAVRALWLVSADVPDELVAGITAAFWHPQSQAFLRGVHPSLADLGLDRALDGMDVPVHPGAGGFYRAQGLAE